MAEEKYFHFLTIPELPPALKDYDKNKFDFKEEHARTKRNLEFYLDEPLANNTSTYDSWRKALESKKKAVRGHFPGKIKAIEDQAKAASLSSDITSRRYFSAWGQTLHQVSVLFDIRNVRKQLADEPRRKEMGSNTSIRPRESFVRNYNDLHSELGKIIDGISTNWANMIGLKLNEKAIIDMKEEMLKIVSSLELESSDWANNLSLKLNDASFKEKPGAQKIQEAFDSDQGTDFVTEVFDENTYTMDFVVDVWPFLQVRKMLKDVHDKIKSGHGLDGKEDELVMQFRTKLEFKDDGSLQTLTELGKKRRAPKVDGKDSGSGSGKRVKANQ